MSHNRGSPKFIILSSYNIKFRAPLYWDIPMFKSYGAQSYGARRIIYDHAPWGKAGAVACSDHCGFHQAWSGNYWSDQQAVHASAEGLAAKPRVCLIFIL